MFTLSCLNAFSAATVGASNGWHSQLGGCMDFALSENLLQPCPNLAELQHCQLKADTV